MAKADPGLLTITEAAAYLNVSKVTIRRWTNDGVLNCVRIGARGERRFKQADLVEFTSASGSNDNRHQAGGARELHARHQCIVSKNPEEEWGRAGSHDN